MAANCTACNGKGWTRIGETDDGFVTQNCETCEGRGIVYDPKKAPQTFAESEMRRALACLRLEVRGAIVDDIERVFNAYVKQVTPKGVNKDG